MINQRPTVQRFKRDNVKGGGPRGKYVRGKINNLLMGGEVKLWGREIKGEGEREKGEEERDGRR